MRLLLVASYLLLAGCALERDVPMLTTAGPLDSLVRAQPGLRTGKVKFSGPITFQLGGAGNVATTLTKVQAPVASAPRASASATTRPGVPAWVLVAGGVLVLLGLAYKLRKYLIAVSL